MSLKRFEDEDGNLYVDEETRDYIRHVGDVIEYPPYVRGTCGARQGELICQIEPNHVSYRPHMCWDNKEQRFKEWVDEKITMEAVAAAAKKSTT